MLKRTLVLGRYECVERLAAGPVGETWRVKRYGPTGVEGQFALLRLHALLAQGPGLDTRLQVAVEAYRTLAHQDAVPRLCEVGQSGPHRFLVFDLPPGASVSSLRALLLAERTAEAAALLPRAAAFVGRRVAEIVQAAHGYGLSAQGLDPDSVLVDETGKVWVMAFGLTGALLPRPPPPELGPLLAYLPPEVLQGEVAGPRSDVYSLGALVRAFLTGAAPGSAATGPAGGVPPAFEHTLASLWQAVERALAPHPLDRPTDAAAFAALLAPDEAEQEVRGALAQLAARRQRLSAPSAAPSMETPVVAPERVLLALSADSLLPPDEPLHPAPGVGATACGVQPLPVAASAAIASLSGIVLAVEEEEHTVPVPHSPKSQIKIIEAEPPSGARPRPDAGLPEPAPPPAALPPPPSVEVLQLPGAPLPSASLPPMAGNTGPVPDSIAANEPSGRTQIMEAAGMPSETSGPLQRQDLSGGSLLPAQETPEPEFLEELDETTAQAEFGVASTDGERGEGPAAELRSHAGSGEDVPAPPADLPPSPPQSPSLADQFPPLITDPVPRIAAEEVARPSRRQPPPPPQPRRLSLPSLSQDNDSLDGMGGDDDPTGSIPDAPARILAALADEAPSDVPISSAPPPPPAHPRPQSAPASPPAPVEIPPSPTPTPAPVSRPVTAPRSLLRSKSISPAVVASFVAALLIGGSVPVLVRALRRPPRPTGSAAVKVATPRPVEARPTPVASAQPAAPASAPGMLELSTTPAGAMVFVDGKPAGRSPLTLSLGDGRRRLVIMAERYQLIQREVDASASSLRLELQPVELPASVAGPAGLKVRCSTRGQLRIFVDGHDSGYTCPTERINLSPGTHKVEFFRPRTGDRVARTITIKKGKSGSVRLYTKF